MAHQLIYTSAPRLLEAGRTGFGTVARHRAVGALLAAAVERVSQFAHTPGLNPRRVVFSHRILHVGAGSHHLLSCIRDAGSDYTGRTNHIAHHLILEAREARSAAEAGLTPADVLRQMRWLGNWNESPRFFGPDEEVSVTSFRPSLGAGAWQKLTDDAANAALPAQAQRCLLLLPGEEGALELFHESLAKVGGTSSWLVTFTTHVEPTDDLADLRWLALAHDSPLRSQVESASRTVFDLTQPQTLPAPRLFESKTIPVSAAIPQFQPPASPVTAPVQVATPLPPLFPENHPRRVRSPWPLVAVAAGMALLGMLSWLLPQLPRLGSFQQNNYPQDAISLARDVDELWQRHRLQLPATQNWLKAQADKALVEAHRETLQQILAAIREPLRPAEISMPPSTQDEFTDLVLSFRSWLRWVQEGVRDPAWSGDDPQEVLSKVLVTISRMEEQWSKVALVFGGVPEMPEVLPAEIHQQVLKHLAARPPSQGTPRQWLDLLSSMQLTTSEEPGWIHAWELASKAPAQLTEADCETLKKAQNLPEAPVWLRDQIHQQLQVTSAQAPVAVTPPPVIMPPAETTREPVLPADGPASAHPRYIVMETALMSLVQALEQLPSLPTEPEMQVFIGSVGDPESRLARLRPLGAAGVYRKSFNDPLPLEFSQRRLVRLPDPMVATRLISRNASGAQVLFEVIILPKAAELVDAWPASEGFSFKAEIAGTATYLDAQASRWLQSLSIVGNPPLRLQNVDDPSRRFRLRAENRRMLVEADLSPASDSSAKSRLVSLDQELEALRQGIRIDEQRRSELAASKLAKAQKEEQARRLDDSLAVRQQRLLQLEEDRKDLVPMTPASLGLPKGIYSLFAGLRRLCEIKIESAP